MDLWVVIYVRNPMPGVVSDIAGPHAEIYGREADAYVRGLQHLEDFLSNWNTTAEEAQEDWAEAIAVARDRVYRGEAANLLRRWNLAIAQVPGAERIFVEQRRVMWNPLANARLEAISEAADRFVDEEPLEHEIEDGIYEVASEHAHALTDDELLFLYSEGVLEDPDSEDFALAGYDLQSRNPSADFADILRNAATRELQSQISVEDVENYLDRHTEDRLHPDEWTQDLAGVPFVLSLLQEYVAFPGNQVPGIDIPIERQWYPNRGRFQFNVQAVLPEAAEELPIQFSRGRGYTHEGGFWRPGASEDLDELAEIIEARVEAVHPDGWRVQAADTEEHGFRNAILIDFNGRGRGTHHADFRIDLELEPYDIREPEMWPEGATEWEAPVSETRMPPPSFIPTPRHRTIGATSYQHPTPRTQRLALPIRPRLGRMPIKDWPVVDEPAHNYSRDTFSPQLSLSAQIACALTAVEMVLGVWDDYMVRVATKEDTAESRRTLSYDSLPREALALAWRALQEDVPPNQLAEMETGLTDGSFWVGGGDGGDAAHVLYALEYIYHVLRSLDFVNARLVEQPGSFVLPERWSRRIYVAVREAQAAYQMHKELQHPHEPGQPFEEYMSIRNTIAKMAATEFMQMWWERCQQRLAFRDVDTAVLL